MADAGDREIEAARAHTLQRVVDILGRAFVHFADETQSQVQFFRSNPAGAGDAAAQSREPRADVFGKADADEQADHKRLL